MYRRDFLKGGLALAVSTGANAAIPNPPTLGASSIWNPPKPPTEGIRTATKTLDKTWQETLNEITGGGRIVVEPGHHVLTHENAYKYFYGWGDLEIIGLPSPTTGERPLLDLQLTADGQGIGNFLGYSGNNGNVWIKDLRIHGSTQNIIAMGSGPNWPHKQTCVLDNVELAYAGHHILMFAYEFSGRLVGEERKNPVNDELWIRDSELHHSGYTHVHYCDRIFKEVVVRSKFHTARSISGHAFKSIARNLTVVDSEISNVGLDGAIDYDCSHYSCSSKIQPFEFYLGAVPVSIVGGQRGYFARNKLTHRTHANYNAGAYTVAMQTRHNIHTLEVPDPMDLTSEYYDPTFWTERAEYWSMRFEDNDHILLGDSVDMPRQKLYINQGTYPVHDGLPIVPLPPEGREDLGYVEGQPYCPKEWFDRSRPICSGDRIRGFTLRGKDLYHSSTYGHTLNPTDDPVGRFVIETMPVEF